MDNTAKVGLPVIGIIFLVLAVYKLLSGEPSVVWFLLSFLFGGFGIFKAVTSGGRES